MGIRALIMPTCKELAERLSSGAYDRAPLPVRLAVRWHLYRCALCDKYARQVKLLAEGYRQAASPAPAGIKKRLADKLRRR